MIELESYDLSVMGMKWTGSAWIEDPNPPEPVEPVEPEPSNADIMVKLEDMTTGQVSTATLDAAYQEGVNSYV